MQTLLIAIGAGLAFVVAYHTYGRWLGSKIFDVSANLVCPSHRLRDDKDYVPTSKSIVFGHHFTSIAGTGPIVGPAIAVMWGWLPALLWVVLGSIFIGAVHDFGSLVVSLRNNGQTVGDIAGRVLNRRVRVLFLLVLFLALTIVLAIFGLVIAAVFRQYPQSIFPCLVQIPIAVLIGVWVHRRGKSILIPSIIALVVMYLTVIYGDVGVLHTINQFLAEQAIITWVAFLLVYSYIASVLPVWTLLQPRDYINSLQLITALGLIVVGLVVAAVIGGAPPVEGATRQPLEVVAPMVKWDPAGAPLIFPFLFITIACGAISGFHCLVSSGTSSKQLDNERDARFVGYGSMLTEGFLATIVILACVAGLGLGLSGTIDVYTAWDVTDDGSPAYGYEIVQNNGKRIPISPFDSNVVSQEPLTLESTDVPAAVAGTSAWKSRYLSWGAAGSLGAKVGAFVDGSANFLKAMGIPAGWAVALMGVLVASFAGTTLDTACRLQRYVVQELARALREIGTPTFGERGLRCARCGYDLKGNVSGACPECGYSVEASRSELAASLATRDPAIAPRVTSDAAQWFNPLVWLSNKHGATIFAVGVALAIAAMPSPGKSWSWANSGGGGMILWPMFGATNQLLGGLAFMVIAFYLWRRRKPIWFLVLPLVFMLIMPAWAMGVLLPEWLSADATSGGLNWPLIVIAVATLALEVWMIVEAVILLPRVKGLLERELPGSSPTAPGVDVA